MLRKSRRNPVLPNLGRTVPPLPHPSWTYGTQQRPTLASALQPEEFWAKLGL